MPIVTDLQLTITPATALYTNPVPDGDINAYETTTEGRHAVVLDFNGGEGLYARDLGTIFQWPTTARTVLYVWQPSVIPQPETIYGRATDWNDCGTIADKFFQGVRLEANSFNVVKNFQLQSSDDLSLHALLEAPAVFNGQSVKTFSCVPFVAHSVRLVSSDGIPWQIFEWKPVFEPWPSACLDWHTEMTSLGLVGWAHAREINLAHVSTADITLSLTFDAWPTITLTIPNSGGLQQKLKITLPANKFKLIGFEASSTQIFRLFLDDMQVKVKSWGSQQAYEIIKPFGGHSKVGALV